MLALVICPGSGAAAASSASPDFPGSEGIPVLPSDQQSFESWLKATGWPVSSRYHGYRANYLTWRTYKLLVYGTPNQVHDNRYDSQMGQYAVLGFSYDEIEVTNSLFRDDSPGGRTRTTPWQWEELDMGQSARISWARLDERQKQFIKGARLTYRNNSYGGMTFGDLKLSESKTVVLAQPSWHLGFALYTTHYRPGSRNDLRYATFNGQGAGQVNVRSAISVTTPAAANGSYVMDSLADHIDIKYVVSGSIASYSGLATAMDIQNRGAGNEQGWISGSGNGPWTVPLTLTITRAELGSKRERQFILRGNAWVVSRMGDVQLSQTEKTISVKAAAAAPAFDVQADIRGSIHYFSGQTNSQGLTLPINPHRFLAMERMNIILDFTRDPQSIEYTFNGAVHKIACVQGIKHYETSLLLPNLPSTLTWDGQRLQAAMKLTIKAADRSSPVRTIIRTIKDIELTGNIYNIAYAQISR